MAHGLARARTVFVRSLRVVAARPAVRRLLVICGLVVAGWLLGGLAGTAHADVSPPCSTLGGAVRETGEGALRAVAPDAPPAELPEAGSVTPDAWPADDTAPPRLGDLLPERLPEVVNPPGEQERTEPDRSERTVPAGPGDISTPRGHERGADDGHTARTGSYEPHAAKASAGGHRSDADRPSHIQPDEDGPVPPMGGDWPLPAAGSAFAGAGGLLGGYLGHSGRTELPQAVPSPRPAVDAPVVRTAVDEPSFSPD